MGGGGKKKKKEASEKRVWLLQVVLNSDSFLPVQPIPPFLPQSPVSYSLEASQEHRVALPQLEVPQGAWCALAPVPGQLLVKTACHWVKQMQFCFSLPSHLRCVYDEFGVLLLFCFLKKRGKNSV